MQTIKRVATGFAVFVAVALLATSSASAAGTGRVAVYPPNHHYLMDANGSPFLLIGYGDEQLNDAATLDQLSGRVNYVRSYFAVFIRHYGWNSQWQHEPWAVVGGKVDMDTWKDDFWTKLRQDIRAAETRHLVVGLTIWDGHTALPGGKAGTYSFWNADKNVQSIQWHYDVGALERYPYPAKDGGSSQRLVYYQRRVVDKLLEEIKGFPNVIIELNNEDSHGASERWWLWWAKYFKERGYVVAVNETAGGQGALPDAAFAASPFVDAKFYHWRTDATLTPARYDFNKVVTADADTDCKDLDPDRSRRIAWKAILRGGGWNDFVCMQESFPNHVKTGYYGHLLDFFASHHIPFWDMAPMGELSSSGIAFARPGANYLVYAEHDVTVDLSGASGKLQYSWYDPRTGKVARSATVLGGGKRDFTIPGADDYILWITAAKGN